MAQPRFNSDEIEIISEIKNEGTVQQTSASRQIFTVGQFEWQRLKSKNATISRTYLRGPPISNIKAEGKQIHETTAVHWG
jgi:hypothetical protein